MPSFHTLDVFTREAFGGNPLAVVFGADPLDRARMQRIAREFNLSETVFVLAASEPGATQRLRIFTPREELSFAGHPIVGTACLIGLNRPTSDAPLRLEFETAAGRVPVLMRLQDGLPYAELRTPRLPAFSASGPDAATIAAALDLSAENLGFEREGPCVADCGLPMLLAPLRSPELLAGIDVDIAALRRLLSAAGAYGLYVYARGYDGELRARMFSASIGEDPATGSAAAALAGRLASESAQVEGTQQWRILQGAEMGRPSTLFASADKADGQVTAVRIGGHAVPVMHGELDVR